MAAKIEELPDSGSDDDDAPPPLEDMSDTLRFKDRFTAQSSKRAELEAKQKDAAAKAVAAAASIGKFTKGTIVELFGLSNDKFNGKQGTVAGYVQESGRHMVKLSDSKTIKVKPENLKRLESFSGFGKGFLSSSKRSGADGDDDIEFVAAKNPEEKTGVFSEVQEAMKQAAPFLEQNKDKWCTPALMEKLAQHPNLMALMGKPQFSMALTEFQQNPASAMAKYGDNPQISEFFRQFCGVMGDHLTEIGEAEEGKVATSTSQIAPSISPQDEAALQEALAKPQVKEALQDLRIQKMIEDLKLRPERATQITSEVMRDKDLTKKVQALIQAGLLGTTR